MIKIQKEKWITFLFIFLFILLNIINTFFITTQTLNRYVVPVRFSIKGTINGLIGNVTIVLFYLFLVNLFTKKSSNKMLGLVITTFILNGYLFAVNVFNRYYASSFSLNSLKILKNPAEGVGMGIAIEAFKELFTYYRIIFFIPFFILLLFFIIYKLKIRNKKYTDVEINFSPKILFVFLYLLVIGSFTSLYGFSRLVEDEKIIQTSKATYASQYLGTYHYNFLELFGFDLNEDLKSIEQIALELEKYNKNQSSYKSFIDGKQYEWSVKKKDIENIYGSLIDDLDDDEYINGILSDYNLVLIHLETFNHFLLEIEETRNYLPDMIKIMNESYVFDNFYTNVGLGNSFDAEVSVLTGIYGNGVSNISWDYNKIGYSFETIPNMFKDRGYDSVWSIHGDTKEFYNREEVHPKMFGFDIYYAKEHFILPKDDLKYKDGGGYGYNHEDYNHNANVWVSDRALFNFINDAMRQYDEDEKFMMFGITMLPHIPYRYDPYDQIDGERESLYPEFENLVDKQTMRYLNFMEYYNDLFKSWMFPNNYSEIPKNTAFLFYGDHGSTINNGDLDILYKREEEMSNIEMRKLLLQTTSFLYVPDENGIGKLKGSQSLVRGQSDLFRTVVDLFDLPMSTNNNVYGVHGMSREKTFAIDNKALDVVMDGYIFNLKNNIEIFKTVDVDLNELAKIKRQINNFKYYSDMVLYYNLFDDLKKYKEDNEKGA